MDFLEKNFRSRKFLITLIVAFAAFFMAAAEKLGSPLALVLLSAVASYNAANVLAADSVETLKKYLSRKFLITLVIVVGSCVFAYLSLKGLSPGAGNVLTTCVASYNGFNALKAVITKRKDKPSTA